MVSNVRARVCQTTPAAAGQVKLTLFDVDATLQGTDEWYELVARSRPPKDMPWYHVLVDGGGHTTYVAERHLESDESREPIRHPLVAELCGEFQEGRYSMRSRLQ